MLWCNIMPFVSMAGCHCKRTDVDERTIALTLRTGSETAVKKDKRASDSKRDM